MRKGNYRLILILVLAFILRIVGLNFGFPFFLHPDETKIIEPALTIAFNIKTADFKPHFFYYPHFLMYLLVGIVQILKIILLPFGTFSNLPKETFYLIARLITVFFGTASVYLTYLIGKKVAPKGWEERVGLMSALFLGTTFLHVRNSHYYTGDVPATFFMLLSFYFFLSGILPKRDTPESGVSRLGIALAGVFAGIGISTKYYPALLLVLYIPALIYQYRKNFKAALLRCLLIVITAVLGFLMFTPYALLDNQKFLRTMKESSLRSSSGFMGAASNNLFYYIYNKDSSIDESFSGNSLVEGLGWGFVFFVLFGVFLVFNNKTIKPYNNSLFLVFVIVALYYVFFSRYPTKLVRWLVPIVPFMSVLISYCICRWKLNRVFFIVVCAFIIFPNLYKSIRFDYALSRGDTRVRAYNYILENIPKGTPMIFESILIHKMVEDGDYPLFQITHDRYNTKGEIENDYPPNLDEMLSTSNAKYIIVNGWARQKYFNPSSYTYFPEVSAAWRDFYNEIDKRFPKSVIFDPQSEKLSGPKITIYNVLY